MNKLFEYPYAISLLQRKRKFIKKELISRIKENNSSRLIRIAILGGGNSSEISQMIELFLLQCGFIPEIYESGFNRYYEEVIFDTGSLNKFTPDVVLIHVTQRDIENLPNIYDKIDVVNSKIEKEFLKYKSICENLILKFKCPIIHNNFEYPESRPMGNLEASSYCGKIYFINQLNEKLYKYCTDTASIFINDLNYLAASFGLHKWHDSNAWCNYKFAYNLDAYPFIAANIVNIIKAIKGISKKCLVLDLDNTLWGGVIGDDGIEGILLGNGNPIGEAFQLFQKYIKRLKERGVILAICSKNEIQSAIDGFSHPSSILKFEDFAEVECSWNSKVDGLKKIASKLNIGLDSIVFFDDNPAERKLISDNLPQVSVPNIGEDVGNYLDILDKSGFFETTKVLDEDLKKISFYKQNAERNALQLKYENHHDFLLSLKMKAEIKNFSRPSVDRISQLINKTNQFNLTNKRMDQTIVDSLIDQPNFMTLCARLEDIFGDNGLVSALVGQIKDHCLYIDLWVMSCRVFSRNLELAIFDTLIEKCIQQNIKKIQGVFHESKKNAIVSCLYQQLGFNTSGNGTWEMTNLDKYIPLNQVIEVTK
ncbi:MAG: HAD family hydrolase [Oligoflexia bacterium]|nr:HAD family hydrolase [Oligoflexia bacterium]